MDILTGENLSSIEVANSDLIYWPMCSSSRSGAWGKGGLLIVFNHLIITKKYVRPLKKG